MTDELLHCATQSRYAAYGLTHDAVRFLTREIVAASTSLQISKLVKQDQFDAAVDRALARMSELPFGPQDEYLGEHRARFYELANVVDTITRDQKSEAPRILDVGMSVNTLILSELMPTAVLSAADRPDVVPAIPKNYPIRVYSTDLTSPDLDTLGLGERFDVIVFAEVIEHLLADPVRVLRFFIHHLTPLGRLVVTTPNFFARHNLNAMRERKNPQPIFKSTYTRQTANAHHVREYAMSELLEMAEEAGGLPVAFYYSACWDTDLSIPEEERLNLCVVIGPDPKALSNMPSQAHALSNVSSQFDYGETEFGEFVDLLYRGILRREPDAAGRAAWIRHLIGGMGQYDVIRGFLSSEEFKRPPM